ncbi:MULTISPECIES: LysR family transcriptional regulator [Ensifer]|jgi:LysR family transcriptional regulator, transcriptional activator for bauABCD operon|uniref:LysR family transcriptional regulator n=1 Tax=Ensifer TaxID=106591 RepID=UPI00042E398B|nr:MULTISPECIES: LysR family transcriptional regulator [Ensifer]AHK46864.1 putative transcriptional regulator LysR [Ensifer adhaerens OV14]MDP9629260.1 DNA-binding transcriptional LysR family regulator [Ensifer adhaerens]KQW50341.1 LysR family transcriptional regulator [Ensifer sp. Root1252]KQY63106.1 LysR family transcriptional regulator [Ensifer sp. Root142]KRC74565.1 LysR family transcriptional regulator [Ensifer sp. Root231]
MINKVRHRVLHLSLGDAELRLLRVFASVVQHGGFSAAQSALGMTQATISTHMRHLEERLGLRLCSRGRGGFLLTDEGRLVYEAALELFGSLEKFQGRIGEAQGELTGSLSFGTVDAMITNRNLDLQGALAAFHAKAPRVHLEIDVAAPQVLHQGLLNGTYQIVLMPSVGSVTPHFRSQPAFSEMQKLYCAEGHPLFATPDGDLTDAVLETQSFAGRTYMLNETICGVNFTWAAATPHMEGTLLLLLSGAYIGFLPDHYADEWVRDGRLRLLAPERMSFEDLFHIAYPRNKPSRAAETMAQAITESVRKPS